MKCQKVLLAAAQLLILGLPIFASLNSLADDIRVIANPSVKADSISIAELKRVFLQEEIALADGTHVEPVIENGGSVNAAFRDHYLGVNEDSLQDYYRTLVFSGRGFMPKALGSDAEVVAYVAHTRGAIGYVGNSCSVQGVKVLAVGASGSGGERILITRVEPDYPETLKRLNIGGTVRLRLSISTKGNVEHVELLGGNPILAESAVLAVRKWVYAPARSRTIAEVSITFDGK
jgi:TonB family protein